MGTTLSTRSSGGRVKSLCAFASGTMTAYTYNVNVNDNVIVMDATVSADDGRRRRDGGPCRFFDFSSSLIQQSPRLPPVRILCVHVSVTTLSMQLQQHWNLPIPSTRILG